MPDDLKGRIERVLSSGKSFAELAQELCGLLRREPRYNWVGIYMLESEDTLALKAWDGPKATEHTRIPVSQGVCGAAVRESRTIIVDDVSKDPRYLACFLNTRSEIVVPIYAAGRVVGEIDIDGDKKAAFKEADRVFLEWVSGKLGEICAKAIPTRPRPSRSSPA